MISFTHTPNLQRDGVGCSAIPDTEAKRPANRKVTTIDHGDSPALNSDTDNNEKLTWAHSHGNTSRTKKQDKDLKDKCSTVKVLTLLRVERDRQVPVHVMNF